MITAQLPMFPKGIILWVTMINSGIHERSTDADFAMLVVRKLAAQAPDIKIIVMSTTMQERLMVRYFAEVFIPTEIASLYFISVKCYPAQWFFIDQLHLLATKERAYWHKAQKGAAMTLKHLMDKYLDENKISAKPLVSMDVCTGVSIVNTSISVSVSTTFDRLL